MESNKETAPQRPLCHTHKSNCHSASANNRDENPQGSRPLVYTCKVKLSPRKQRTE